MNENGKQQRGFAVMPAGEKLRVRRMGGMAVSRNREYMAEIGRRGGKNAHRNDRKRHMYRIADAHQIS